MLQLISIALAVQIAAPMQAKPDAHTLYAEGRACYASRHYACAVERWRRAFLLTGAVALRYDIARAAEKNGESALAIVEYRAWLRLSPDAPERDAVRRHVEVLEGHAPPPKFDLHARQKGAPQASFLDRYGRSPIARNLGIASIGALALGTGLELAGVAAFHATYAAPLDLGAYQSAVRSPVIPILVYGGDVLLGAAGLLAAASILGAWTSSPVIVAPAANGGTRMSLTGHF